MDDTEFDRALIASAFGIAAERGWRAVSVAEAARRGGLRLDRARARFPARPMLLLRFGSLADQAALASADSEGPHRDRLFGILMRRIDALQANRDGVIALLRGLPADPCTAAMLAGASLRSMGWMLEAAGIGSTGPLGLLRAKALLVVWLATLRAWERDTGEELSATMAALDKALQRAEQVQGWFARGGRAGDAAAPASPGIEPDPVDA
jgi:hypothetical protein